MVQVAANIVEALANTSTVKMANAEYVEVQENVPGAMVKVAGTFNINN